MERKGGTSTVEVETESIQRKLSTARTLTAEEEKALRIRHGAGVGLNAPLARAAPEGSELADEPFLMEMQLVRAFRARGRNTVAAGPAKSPTKDKIVRALRKKR